MSTMKKAAEALVAKAGIAIRQLDHGEDVSASYNLAHGLKAFAEDIAAADEPSYTISDALVDAETERDMADEEVKRLQRIIAADDHPFLAKEAKRIQALGTFDEPIVDAPRGVTRDLFADSFEEAGLQAPPSPYIEQIIEHLNVEMGAREPDGLKVHDLVSFRQHDAIEDTDDTDVLSASAARWLLKEVERFEDIVRDSAREPGQQGGT